MVVSILYSGKISDAHDSVLSNMTGAGIHRKSELSEDSAYRIRKIF